MKNIMLRTLIIYVNGHILECTSEGYDSKYVLLKVEYCHDFWCSEIVLQVQIMIPFCQDYCLTVLPTHYHLCGMYPRSVDT